MQTRMWGKTGFMAFKLDMNKAYDIVEWVFLEALLLWMGFNPNLRWVRLIMQFIKTVRYSILIKGQPVGNICPTREIRQGDPLSPYLFILCAETLSSLLHHAERTGWLIEVPTSPRDLG